MVLVLDTDVVYVVAHAAIAAMLSIPCDTVVIDARTDGVHVMVILLMLM